MLITGGNHPIAIVWDLKSDDHKKYFSHHLPHVTKHGEISASTTDVSSVHWNDSGTKLVTSSSDTLARVWKIDADHSIKLEKFMGFTEMLMNSKFNKGEGNLVATGGHSNKVTVWNVNEKTELCKLEHAKHDESFEGIEIEW